MISSRWKAALAALFLFVAGIAVGVGGTVGYGVRHFRQTVRDPAAAGVRSERAMDRIHTRLVKELALDAAQSAMVQTELERTRAEIRAQRLENAQRTRRTLAAGFLRIGANLPPEKRAEFRKLAARRLERLGLDLRDTSPEAERQP